VIFWFTAVQIGIALFAGVLCVVLGAIGRQPSDLSMGAIALVTLLLLAQLVVTILAPLLGNHPKGGLGLFYVYLVAAIVMPFAGGFWALIERSRWSTMILGAICVAIAVMLYRMGQIWFIPGY
jgi:uncharacterized membrane protein YoaK (UPF0700 family)